MNKIVKKLLLVVLFLIGLGISGCSDEKASNATSQSTLSFDESSLAKIEASNITAKVQNLREVQQIPVLYYHSIMLEEGNEVRMPPEQFEAQMSYMRDKGYESVSLNELYNAFYNNEILPPKPFVITFDDGYEDNYTNAFPIVEKYGFTATVFMVSSYIDGDGFLSWTQLRELVANEWEVAGHTVSHPYLSQCDRKALFNELLSSKETLEKGLGQPIKFFAYPYGDVNEDVAQAVKDSGYVMAFTTKRGWVDLSLDKWHQKRVYCFANMGLNEFSRRLQDSNY